jgi:hypothetical protein
MTYCCFEVGAPEVGEEKRTAIPNLRKARNLPFYSVNEIWLVRLCIPDL